MILYYDDTPLTDLGEGVERRLMAHGGTMMCVEFTFKKGAVGKVHSHPHEQVGYISAGSFDLEIDGTIQTLRAGDTYYVPPNTKHGVVALEDSKIIDVFTPQRDDFKVV